VTQVAATDLPRKERREAVFMEDMVGTSSKRF